MIVSYCTYIDCVSRTTAGGAPPKNGPHHQIHCCVQSPVTAAGPKERAGLIDVPVMGIVLRCATYTAMPITNGPSALTLAYPQTPYQRAKRWRIRRQRVT